MKQSNIIFLLFSFSITACIYAVFSDSIFKSQVIHTSPVSNNTIKADTKNKNINVTYYSDEPLTVLTNDTPVDESYDTIAADNPHLPIAYKTETHQINPEELEREEDDPNKAQTMYLEEGQSRTFIYTSTGINNANPEENENIDEDENNNNGYFLQPGQSRTFFANQEKNYYTPDEEASLLH